MSEKRFPELSPETMTDEQRQVAEAIQEPAAQVPKTSRAQQSGCRTRQQTGALGLGGFNTRRLLSSPRGGGLNIIEQALRSFLFRRLHDGSN
jgi:hypothetical protein